MSSYSYVRFRWWSHINLDDAAEQLKSFKITRIPHAKSNMEISLFQDERDELEVEADTLKAFLTSTRVLLSQKERTPFSKRDLELRDKMIMLYPHDRPTPFPWEWSVEPTFESVR